MADFFLGPKQGDKANSEPKNLKELQAAENFSEQPSDLYSNAQRENTFYPHYDIMSAIYTETGIQMMKVAAATGFARPVRLNAPYSVKVVIWNAERIGLRPVLPAWEKKDGTPLNGNEVLLKMIIVPHVPKLVPGGEMYYFKCEGVYVFGLCAALRAGDSFWAGCTPCAVDAADALKTEGYQFSEDILASLVPQDYIEESVKTIT